jgi:hypothetical protein
MMMMMMTMMAITEHQEGRTEYGTPLANPQLPTGFNGPTRDQATDFQTPHSFAAEEERPREIRGPTSRAPMPSGFHMPEELQNIDIQTIFTITTSS